MKLLHEEYTDFGQLLDEMPTLDALSTADSYFGDRDEDSFGLADAPTETEHNIMSRFTARKGT